MKKTITKGLKALTILFAMLMTSYVSNAQVTTLWLSSYPSSRGTITVDGVPGITDLEEDYVAGTVLHLVAVPNDGSEFINWRDDENTIVSTEADFNYTVTDVGYRELTAYFQQTVTRYTVTAIVDPAEAGSVAGEGLINEGDEARLYITHNDEVHYHFDGWSYSDTRGSEESDNQYFPFIVTENTTVYAYYTYANQLLNVTVEAEDGGTATVTYGGNTATTITNIPENNNFTLTATPEGNNTFVGWSRAGSSQIISTVNPWTHAMPGFSSDSTYTAHFTNPELRYFVVVDMNIGGGNPSISPNPGASGILSGASVTIAPGTYSDYTFLGWYEDFNGNGTFEDNEYIEPTADFPNYIFNITSDRHFQARYRHNSWPVTLTSNPVGAAQFTTMGDNGDGTVDDHGSFTATVSVAAGQELNYRFDRWSGDNVSTNATINIQSVTRAYSFTANFINTYTLDYSATNGGNVTVTSSIPANANGTYDAGTDITVTAAEVAGKAFDFWTVDGIDYPELTEATYTLENIDHHATIVANYVNTYTVTVNSNPSEVDGLQMTINGNAATAGQAYEFREGDEVTVAVADFNTTTYEFLKWSAAGSGDPLNEQGEMFYTFTMGAANYSFIAFFQERERNYIVTTSVNDPTMGSISSSRLNLVDGVDNDVVSGTVLDLLATPTSDAYRFDYWDIDGEIYRVNPLNNGAMVRVTGDMNITAYFRELGNVNITVVKHPNAAVGEILPYGDNFNFTSGDVLTITAQPVNPNYEFWGWIVDGALVGAMSEPSLTLTPTEDMTIHAWFYAPSVEGNMDYLNYNEDSTIVLGVKPDYKTRVTAINIPVLQNGHVTTIAEGAFQGCTSLESINLVPTITTVADNAFLGCTALTSIDISSVTTLGNRAFYGCSALQSVLMSNGLTAIGDETFDGCTALTDVVIPASVESIGNRAFNACRNIYSVELPAGVATVGNQAFMGNSNLRVVTINGGVTSFGGDAFKSCNNIAQVYFNGDLAQWFDIEFGTELSNPAARSHSLTVNGELLTNLDIPYGVTEVKAYAFYLNTNIETIVIPATMQSIDSVAFYRLTNLRRIIIEGNPEEIDVHADAFSNVNKANVVIEVPCAYTDLTEWNGFTRIIGTGIPVLTLRQRVGGSVNIISAPECGSGDYTYTISAQAIDGYIFRSWSDGALAATRDITLTADMTLSAIFDRNLTSTPVSDRTYDFEAANAAQAWFNIADGDNNWMVGNAVYQPSYGTNSLYVSKDGGTTCSYNLGNSPYVYTELKLHDGIYRFSFNYLLNDIEAHNLTVALIPIADEEADDAYMHLDPYAEEYPLLIDQLNGDDNTWKDIYRLFEIPTEQWYRLVFFYNVNSDETPADIAAAVDNVTFNWMTPKPSDLNNLNATVSVATADATMGKAYTWTGDESVFRMGTMVFPVSEEAVHNNTLYNAFTINDEIWIHALPEEGYQFSHWSDGNTEQHRQLQFVRVYGTAPHYIAYFEPVDEDWTITVVLEDGAEEAGEPASSEYGVIYNVGTARIGGVDYDVKEVRNLVSIEDEPGTQATLVLNQPMAEWAFMGWANENGDTLSTDNPWTITYDDFQRDVTFTALMSKRVECPDVYDPDYYNPFNHGQQDEPISDHDTPEMRDVIVSNINVFMEGKQIVVENTGDYTVTLYDVSGRALDRRVSPDQKIYFDVPLSGSYLIRVGNVLTQRVVVVK